jgi:hypothetical protein
MAVRGIKTNHGTNASRIIVDAGADVVSGTDVEAVVG